MNKNIYLAPFQDQRPAINIIGERTALKVSMGDIYANRDVLAYVREALQNELLASGNNLSEDANSDLVLSGNLLKFWVWTPSTPIYWDIIGEIEVKLTVTFREKGETIDKIYKAKSVTRTHM